MKLTVKVKLLPDERQHTAILETVERFNEACNDIAQTAFDEQCASKVVLQKIVYADIRSTFGLSSQMTIRAIAKVVEAFKRDKTIQPKFKTHGAMVYDQRILSWKTLDRVSILTLGGRELVPYIVGAYQEARPDRIRGQADLILVDGRFYLCVIVDVDEAPQVESSGFLGVDLGIKNIAADSDGETFSGAHLANLRRRNATIRRRLQRKGTKSARRLAKHRRRKEARFGRDVNHRISKKIVRKAFDTGRGIALEDLKGIRDRITVKKRQRRAHASWSFAQLRSFVTYKAVIAGVLVVAVDPRNTSKICPMCGRFDKRNRKTRDDFVCIFCGHAAPADTTAAINIGRRAAVNQPYAGNDMGSLCHGACKPKCFSLG